MDSYIGKNRFLFNDMGPQGDWNRTLVIDNPSPDKLVEQQLKTVTESLLSKYPLFLDQTSIGFPVPDFLEKRVFAYFLRVIWFINVELKTSNSKHISLQPITFSTIYGYVLRILQFVHKP